MELSIFFKFLFESSGREAHNDIRGTSFISPFNFLVEILFEDLKFIKHINLLNFWLGTKKINSVFSSKKDLRIYLNYI